MGAAKRTPTQTEAHVVDRERRAGRPASVARAPRPVRLRPGHLRPGRRLPILKVGGDGKAHAEAKLPVPLPRPGAVLHQRPRLGEQHGRRSWPAGTWRRPPRSYAPPTAAGRIAALMRGRQPLGFALVRESPPAGGHAFARGRHQRHSRSTSRPPACAPIFVVTSATSAAAQRPLPVRPEPPARDRHPAVARRHPGHAEPRVEHAKREQQRRTRRTRSGR